MSQPMQDYVFEQRGRRPAVYLATVISLIMIGVGLAHNAPWYFLVPVGSAGLMTLIMLITNSRSGLALSQSSLHLFKDNWEERFGLSEITQVRVKSFSDGQPSVWLDLKHRPSYRIPGYCFGSSKAFIEALKARGIPVH